MVGEWAHFDKEHLCSRIEDLMRRSRRLRRGSIGNRTYPNEALAVRAKVNFSYNRKAVCAVSKRSEINLVFDGAGRNSSCVDGLHVRLFIALSSLAQLPF